VAFHLPNGFTDAARRWEVTPPFRRNTSLPSYAPHDTLRLGAHQMVVLRAVAG
jgi:hypothetical protein